MSKFSRILTSGSGSEEGRQSPHIRIHALIATIAGCFCFYCTQPMICLRSIRLDLLRKEDEIKRRLWIHPPHFQFQPIPRLILISLRLIDSRPWYRGELPLRGQQAPASVTSRTNPASLSTISDPVFPSCLLPNFTFAVEE